MNPRQAKQKIIDEENKTGFYLVKVSNSLVESFVSRSNAVALKMLFFIAKQKCAPFDNITTLCFSADEFATYCNLDQRTIRDNLKNMQKTSISFVVSDDQGNLTVEESIVLLPRVKYTYAKKLFEVDIYSKVLDLVNEVEKKFTVVDLQNIMSMHSKYSIRMLLILENIYGFKSSITSSVKKQKTFELEDLNEMFGCNYKTVTDFDRKVLKPVKSELDDKSDLSFTYDINYGYKSSIDRGRPKALSITIKLLENRVRQRRLF